MAGTLTMARTLRNGQLDISDGTSTPITMTLILDEGDLSWTETEEPRIIMDRDIISHPLPGPEVPCELSFTAKWTQLISKSATGGDTPALYEMVNNTGDTFASVGATGELYQLQYVFTVSDPAGVGDETVTFANVIKNSLECAESDEYNTIAFTGQEMATKPVIARSA